MFVNEIVCVFVCPSITLPKLTLVGFVESVAVCATPVPLNATVVGEFGAVLVIDKLPVTLPPVVGVNFTVKLLLCPAAMLVGEVNPVTL